MPDIEKLAATEERFLGVMAGNGFDQIDAVPIASGYDPTTRFIGSHVSVFKPFIVPGFKPGHDIPVPEADIQHGIAMLQPCLRTQNLRIATDATPAWASYFRSMGALVEGENMSSLTEAAVGFALNEIEENHSDGELVLRVSGDNADEDLRQAIQDAGEWSRVVVDDLPHERYRHVIGHDAIKGRNFNFAIHDPSTNQTNDFGNMILLESTAESDTPVHVAELAMGSSTMVSRITGMDHPIDAFGIQTPGLDHTSGRVQYLDGVVSAAALIAEGVVPGGSGGRRKTCRSYAENAEEIAQQAGIDVDTQERIVQEAMSVVAPNADTDSVDRAKDILVSRLR